MKVIWSLYIFNFVLFVGVTFGQSNIDCLKSSFEVKNCFDSDFRKQGVWIEKVDKQFSIGMYSEGYKSGFWINISDSLAELESISFFKRDSLLVEVINYKDSLKVYCKDENGISHQLKEQFFSLGKEKVALSNFFNLFGEKIPNSEEEVFKRIMFTEVPSLSKFNNQLLVEFPLTGKKAVYLDFRYIEALDLRKSGRLVLSSIKKVTNGRYDGTHYFMNINSDNVLTLNYSNGWIDGKSLLVSDPFNRIIGEFEEGKLVKVISYKKRENGLYSSQELKIDDALKESLLKDFFGYANSPTDYLGNHKDCNACALDLFNGYYGLNIQNLGFDPNLSDLKSKGIESADFLLMMQLDKKNNKKKKATKYNSKGWTLGD